MNKLTILVLISVFWINTTFGQIQNEVRKVLETKDFVEFENLSLNLTNRKKHLRAYWKQIRDLTSHFQEGIFFFEKSIPNKDKPYISSVYTYRVRLIATKTKIVFYELTEKKNKKVNDRWEPYYEIIDTFKDDKAYEDLKKEFKTIFLTDLNESELFTIDFVYGENCGIAGMKPKGRIEINRLVEKQDKAEIIKWLKSTITEKQIYAIEALYQLQNCGLKLTENEYKMVKFVSNKNGSIESCSGCIFFDQGIKDVTREFDF